jgi:phasin family protein
MVNVPEQFVATNKENLDSFLAFAGIASASAEKLIDLQMKAAKALFADSVKNAQALASARDVQQFTELQTSIAQPAAEKATAYARSVYAVVAETQAEMTRFFEERVGEMNKTMVSALDKAAKSAPAGSDVAVAAVKSAVAAANQAYDAFSKASKQMTEATEATFTAATHTASKKKAA